MSRAAEITLPFPDQERTYRLGIGQLRELQERCGAGPMALHRRLGDGTWLVDDVLQTIRLGAIGGGAKLEEAIKLVKSVEQRPLAEAVPYAQAILAAALVGVPDELFDDVSGGDKAEGKPTPAPTGSPSSASTETPPPPSGGTPGPSIN